MTGPIWIAIGAAGAAAATALWYIARSLRAAYHDAMHRIAADIDDLLDTDDHIEDDVWDRDLRTLIRDSID
jgi:hypothetical protein